MDNKEKKMIIHHTSKFLTNIALELANTIHNEGKEKIADVLKVYENRMLEVEAAHKEVLKAINKKYYLDKTEPEIIRVIGLDMIIKILNEFINTPNVYIRGYVSEKNIHLDLEFTGYNKEDYTNTLNELKIKNWESIISGTIKFNKRSDNNILSSIRILKNNEFFLEWIKKRVLKILETRYPGKKIEIFYDI